MGSLTEDGLSRCSSHLLQSADLPGLVGDPGGGAKESCPASVAAGNVKS